MNDLRQQPERRAQPWIGYGTDMAVIRIGRIDLVGIRNRKLPDIVACYTRYVSDDGPLPGNWLHTIW